MEGEWRREVRPCMEETGREGDYFEEYILSSAACLSSQGFQKWVDFIVTCAHDQLFCPAPGLLEWKGQPWSGTSETAFPPSVCFSQPFSGICYTKGNWSMYQPCGFGWSGLRPQYWFLRFPKPLAPESIVSPNPVFLACRSKLSWSEFALPSLQQLNALVCTGLRC